MPKLPEWFAPLLPVLAGRQSAADFERWLYTEAAKMWGGGYFCTGMTGGKKRRKTLSGADLSEAGARKNLHQLLL